MTLYLGRSYLLAGIFIFFYGIPALLLVCSHLPLSVKLALLGAMGYSCYRASCLHAWRTAPSSVLWLQYSECNKRWSARTKQQRPILGSLGQEGVITPWFILITLRTQNRCVPIFIPKDLVADRVYRQISTFIRQHA